MMDSFNIALTSVTVMALGVNDRDVPDEVAELDPRIYFSGGRLRRAFNLREIVCTL
jgi:hypothetical protein